MKRAKMKKMVFPEKIMSKEDIDDVKNTFEQ